MASFIETVDVSAKELIPDGSGVLIAVSGGVDSMVLMHVLHQLSPKHRWRLVVAHFNHKLRGRASDADQRLIQKIARCLKLKITTASWKGGLAATKKNGLEMAARNARLSFLDKAARRHRCTHIATGHHRDDQVETFFWRLFRGAGGMGLGGMRQVDDFPLNSGLKTVRPLLTFEKDGIRKFANKEKVKFREDNSNQDVVILRNRIRGKLLPYLQRNFNTGIVHPINQSQELVGADAEFARNTAREWLDGKKKLPFEELHLAVQRWAIWHQLIELGIDPQYRQIEDLRLAVEKPFSLDPERVIQRDERGQLNVHEVYALKFSSSNTRIFPKERWNRAVFGNLGIRYRIDQSSPGPKPDRLQFQEQFDADRVGKAILLRHWHRGDRFQPIGMPQTIKLQDLFTNAKVGAAEKRRRVLACTEQGAVFWVQGLRVGEMAKINPETRSILQWEWSELLNCHTP